MVDGIPQELGVWDGKTFCSFENVIELLDSFDNPQNKIKSVHIAGTNGKGSVCAMVSSILLEAGYKVGQFASPHLSFINERCFINGSPVSMEEFVKIAVKVRKRAEELNIDISFFVLTLVTSFLLFVKHNLDFIVVEAGLGGRLDGTNAIKKPSLQQFLPSSHQEYAYGHNPH